MENNTFSYNYSAEKNREVESIRKKYMPHEESKLERLKKLDRKVQNAGTVESLCLGIIGALVFIGADWFTILFCVLGSVIMLPAYPIYRHISHKTRTQLTPKILQLSEEIMRS